VTYSLLTLDVFWDVFKTNIQPQTPGTYGLVPADWKGTLPPDGWAGPGNDLAARFGRDGAHAEGFYGFRLAIRTDLGGASSAPGP
jgi:hypothetical protein